MLDDVRELWKQFAEGASAAGTVGDGFPATRRVVIAGMGGSAFPGDILRVYASRWSFPVTVSRDYVVRDPLGPDTLALVCSFSGNTEETLRCLFDAEKRAGQVVAMSSGGKLQELAQAHGIPHVFLRRPHPGFQPRTATGLFFSAMATILENAGLLGPVQGDLEALSDAFRDTEGVASEARKLAEELCDRIPVIYATFPYAETAARAIKIKFNENAKMPAFSYALPELNHNEMVGYTQLTGPFSAVFLRDPDAGPRMLQRLEASISTLRENGVPCIELELMGKCPVERIFRAIQTFDFVTCFVAEKKGIDPNPVAMVEDFKKRLGADVRGEE